MLKRYFQRDTLAREPLNEKLNPLIDSALEGIEFKNRGLVHGDIRALDMGDIWYLLMVVRNRRQTKEIQTQ